MGRDQGDPIMLDTFLDLPFALNRHRGAPLLGVIGFCLRNLFILWILSWCREGESNPHGVASGGF
jgi:hypothetical protein